MLYVDFLVADVDVVLDVDEIAVADAEILAEAQGGVHGDLALVAQDLLDARYRHMDVFGQPVRRDPHRLHEFFPEDFRHSRGWNHVLHKAHLQFLYRENSLSYFYYTCIAGICQARLQSLLCATFSRGR